MPEKILRIALTPGEPAGIGPDLCLQPGQIADNIEPVVIADPELLRERAARLQLPFHFRTFDASQAARANEPGELCIAPVALRTPAQAGVLDSRNARYVLDTLDIAIAGCQDGSFDAMVTGPVHKGIINDAGIPFTGHTEYLAAATGVRDVVMLLAIEDLRVALVTTHLPLRDVSAAITPEHLQRVIRVLHDGLKKGFGIARPHIKVCGLNPHAGEGGHLGHEENEVITPVLDSLRAEGMDLDGPVPADTVFNTENIAASDAILAMYHDQGLPVLKHRGFGRAVNITLGLPIIRTSVDHGTALDLAGSGKADAGSLQIALRHAVEMAQRA
ncbi:MAG: 4-hydroxythreonine-4-phosphate dehydrogenase PdxA [Gammaproteobacteria bacterium]|nr:4-hydroxythreonine-4-phosphate dehydrogenase PdxA [Gammaproteobacteria bacterium]